MKKIIAFVIILSLALSMSACSYKLVKTDDPVTSESIQATIASTPQTEDSESGSITQNEGMSESVSEVESFGTSESIPAESQESNTDAPSTETTIQTPVTTDKVDLSNVAVNTTATSPAALGQWIKSAAHSAKSGEYEVIYWRITGFSLTGGQKAIEEYEAANPDWGYDFTELESDAFTYALVTYEIYIPEEFSAYDWGMFEPSLSLYGVNPEGGSIKHNGVSYIGAGACYDISDDPGDVFPGDVVYGKLICVAVNQPDVNFVFENDHQDVGKDADYVYEYASYQ